MQNLITNVRRLAYFNSMLYSMLCTALFLLARNFVDLPPLLGNWEAKSLSILQFNLSDNYYPPGAAIALIPFLWNSPDYSFALGFYYFLAASVYFSICGFIQNRKFRIVALLALPCNSYLTWLCLTSADQLVELLLLLSFIFFVLRRHFLSSLIFGFLLCFTRPAYWVCFILIMYLIGKELSNNYNRFKQMFMKLSGIVVLLLTLLFNQTVFGSPNLSTSSSETLFFGNEKFHYLSLPKFDMDVLLKNGISTSPKGVIGQSKELESIENSHLRATIISVKNNPQRYMFSQIQKLDSYFFPIQKIPNLPGQYELAPDEKSILIGEERLTWPLSIGHLIFALYRALWMLLFGFTLVYMFLKLRSKLSFTTPEKYLLLPFLTGIIPGFIFYVETRFKICSELVAIPLFLLCLSKLIEFSKSDDFRKLSY